MMRGFLSKAKVEHPHRAPLTSRDAPPLCGAPIPDDEVDTIIQYLDVPEWEKVRAAIRRPAEKQ